MSDTSELQKDEMMKHLMTAFERGQDIMGA